MYVLVSGREVYGKRMYGIVNLKTFKRQEVNEFFLQELLISFSFLNIELKDGIICGRNFDINDYFNTSFKSLFTYIKKFNNEVTLLDSFGEKFKILESSLINDIKSNKLTCVNLHLDESSSKIVYPKVVKDKVYLKNDFEIKKFYLMCFKDTSEDDFFDDYDSVIDESDLDKVLVIDSLYNKTLNHEFSVSFLHEVFKELNINSLNLDIVGYKVTGFRQYSLIDKDEIKVYKESLDSNKEEIVKYSNHILTYLL